MKGADIKRILNTHGFTQQEVADRLGKTLANLNGQLGKDVPDPTISLGMGHRIAGHRTTAIYIKRDQRKVDEANRKVIDYIKESVPHLSTQDGLD